MFSAENEGIMLSQMHQAIISQQTDIVLKLLDDGVPPDASIFNQDTNSGSSLICLAAQTGNLDIVQLLHQRGATINAPASATTFNNLNSPLVAAVWGGNIALIIYLVWQSKIIYHLNEVESNEYEYAAREAVVLGHLDIVKHFLDTGLSPGKNFKYHPSFTRSVTRLAYYAAEAGHLSVLQLLVLRGADVKAPEEGYISYVHGDYRPIRAAIANGHLEIVRYLLEQDSGTPAIDITLKLFELYSQPFVDPVIEQTCLQILALLFEYGANFQSCFYTVRGKFKNPGKLSRQGGAESSAKVVDENNPLFQACERTLKALFDYGSGMDFPLNVYNGLDYELKWFKHINLSGFNFIGMSIHAKPVSRELLLSCGIHHGIDQAMFTVNDLIHLPDERRRNTIHVWLGKQIAKRRTCIQDNGIVHLTSLERAACFGQEDIVTKRLDAGIDPNERDGCYKPIVSAAGGGHLNIVKLLSQHPDINPKTFFDAMEAAQREEHTEIHDYLNEQLAINATDSEGDTQLYHATSKLHVGRVTELLGKGANPNIGQWKPLSLVTDAFVASRMLFMHFINERLYYSDINYQKQAAIVQLLLQHGADPNAYTYKSPLAGAAAQGNLQSVALLLPVTEKRDITEKEGMRNEKTRHYPWYLQMLFDVIQTRDCIPILTLLKESGADFNVLKPGTYEGKSLLCTVIEKFNIDSQDLLHYLLKNGASPCFLNRDGSSALAYTLKYYRGSKENECLIISLLVKHGANPDLLDDNMRKSLALFKNQELSLPGSDQPQHAIPASSSITDPVETDSLPPAILPDQRFFANSAAYQKPVISFQVKDKDIDPLSKEQPDASCRRFL